jgi:DNA invertase Pin-like site-specific DNA recombinase
MNAVRAVGYARVSSHEQGRSGLGLAAQRATVDAEAAKHGWTIDHRADTGVSGSIAPEDRPALGAILAGIGLGDVLVVAKLDRLGRSALDVLRIAETARTDGWRLVACDLGLDSGTPVGSFALTALAAVAQLERDLIAQRTREALQAAKARGARLGRPVAYPEPVRARIARDRADGRTLQAIADGLDADGIPTVRGGRWQVSSVHRVLASLALDGEAAAAGHGS